MRLTKRHWTTAFAVAALVHAGIVAVVFWRGSDPGAGVTSPGAISVSLGKTGEAAASAVTEFTRVPEAEVVTAAEAAADSAPPDPVGEAFTPPDTTETGVTVPEEVSAGPAPAKVIEGVVQQAKNSRPAKMEETTVKAPETKATTDAEVSTAPPAKEVISIPPRRVDSELQPVDTPEEATDAKIETAVDPDQPDAEAKLVEDVQPDGDSQPRRHVPATTVKPSEEAAGRAVTASPPSGEDDPSRSVMAAASGASARIQTLGIQAVHDEYLRKVLARIARFKRYPLEARRDGVVGKVMVRFTILHDGSLRSPQLAGSSGDSRLDLAALDMLSRASPFPPIPPGLGLGKLALSLPVEFSLNERRTLF